MQRSVVRAYRTRGRRAYAQVQCAAPAPGRLDAMLDALGAAHSILRTRIARRGHEDLQEIGASPTVAVRRLSAPDIGPLDGAACNRIKTVIESELESSYLDTSLYVHVGADFVVLTMPAWSGDIRSLARLRAALLGGRVQSVGGLGYAEVTPWLTDTLADTSDGIQAEWLERVASLPGPSGRTPGEGARRYCRVPLELDATRGDWADVLIAAWAVLMAAHEGNERLVLGCLAHGRGYEQLADIVGPMSKQVPLVAHLHRGKAFRSLVDEIRRARALADDASEYFDGSLVPGGDRALFAIGVNVHEMSDGGAGEPLGGFRAVSEEAYNDATLNLVCDPAGDRVDAVSLLCSVSRFGEEDCRALGEQLVRIWQQVAEDPDIELGRIDVAPLEDAARPSGREAGDGLPARREPREPGQPDAVDERSADGADSSTAGEAEQVLARVLCELLTIPRVPRGIGFFALGGDSILAIQLIARARQAGWVVKPRDVFDGRDIADLASRAVRLGDADETPAVVTGEADLAPVQARFFERISVDRHQYNQATLLDLGSDVDSGALERAIARLLRHHDALRLSFLESRGRWRQHFNPCSAELTARAYEEIAVATPIESEAFEPVLRDIVERAQSRFSLDEAPLIRFTRIHDGRRALLLVVAHHLVVDALSWTTICADLKAAYRSEADGAPERLPSKTAGYKHWVSALGEVVVSDEDLAFWERTLRERMPLPIDGAAANTVAGARSSSIAIDAETAARLERHTGPGRQVGATDVLLTALALAFRGWTGADRLSLMLEDHGRHVSYLDVDTSRTVGWFTSIYPVNVDVDATSGPLACLCAVARTTSAVPEAGLSYGLLRYSRDEGASWGGLREPEICLNYFGRMFSQERGESLLEPHELARVAQHATRSASQPRLYAVEIVGFRNPDGLAFSFVYNERMIAAEIIDRVKVEFARCVERLTLELEASHSARDDSQGDARVVGALHDPSRAIEASYPATNVQSGMVFHSLAQPESGVYVPQHAVEIRFRLDPDAFERAWCFVVERFAALRSGFRRADDGRLVQFVLESARIGITRLDWSDLAEESGAAGGAEVERRFDALLEREWLQPFDFADPPLMRLCLVRIADERYRFVWTYHHVILDGWSGRLVLQALFAAYKALAAGAPVELPATPPYGNYLRWLAGQDEAKALAYWRAELADFEYGARLADVLRAARPADGVAGKHEHSLLVPARDAERLKECARRHGVTLSALCQAAWAILLRRYTESEDVLFGVTVSGRPAELDGVESMVGQFINTLPIRVRFGADEDLGSFLRGVHRKYLDGNEHAYLSLSQIQSALDFDRAKGALDTVVVFESFPAAAGPGEDLDATPLVHLHSVSQNNYPLSLVVVPSDALALTLKYSPAHFEHETVVELMATYAHILRQLPSGGVEPERDVRTVADIDPLTDEERERAVAWSRGEPARYPAAELVSLFRSSADAAPKADALVCMGEGIRISYGELDRSTNRLASFLLELGLRPDARVGICLGRCVDHVVSALACLKAGMAYVPIDPANPADRITRLMADAGLAALITVTEHMDKVSDGVTEIMLLDLAEEREAIAACSDEDPGVSVHPESTAYVIFTSGSTGKPKGVAVPHRALANYVQALDDALRLRRGAHFGYLSSPAADLGYTAVFGALGGGRCLRLFGEDKGLDAGALAAELDEEPLDYLKIVPSHLTALLDAQAGARVLPRECLILGGEAPSAELLERIRRAAPGIRVFNHYGPTETTIGVCTHDLTEPGEPRTIGRPLKNTRCFVLSGDLRHAGIGALGSLHIAGAGLSHGYLDDPRATAQAFLPNPHGAPGERMYASGDRVRFDARGRLVFVGRTDSQIKLRGYRVEVGEVEASIGAHEAVSQVVVEPRRVGERLVLVAYLRGDSRQEAALREFLEARLPGFMQPKVLVWLDEFPLNSNGKLDRRALMTPMLTPTARSVPESPLEERIAAIWSELLGIAGIPRDANFFDLGGDSLLLMRMHARISEELGSSLRITDLFKYTTIAKLAARIDTADGDEPAKRARAPRVEQRRAAIRANKDRARNQRERRTS